MGKKPAPGYAPVYAALYPALASLAREYGYALAVHGSMQRDFDVVAIPWIEYPSTPGGLITAIVCKFAVKVIGEPETKFHGRIVWTLSIGFGQCFIDLSFMPTDKGEK